MKPLSQLEMDGLRLYCEQDDIDADAAGEVAAGSLRLLAEVAAWRAAAKSLGRVYRPEDLHTVAAGVAETRAENERMRAVYEAALEMVPHVSMPVNGDWACAECRPNSDILVSGFRCRQHTFFAAVAAAKEPAHGE